MTLVQSWSVFSETVANSHDRSESNRQFRCKHEIITTNMHHYHPLQSINRPLDFFILFFSTSSFTAPALSGNSYSDILSCLIAANSLLKNNTGSPRPPSSRGSIAQNFFPYHLPVPRILPNLNSPHLPNSIPLNDTTARGGRILRQNRPPV